MPESPPRFGRTDLLLVLMAAMWGANFSVLKVGLADLAPLPFASIRFVVALGMMYLLARLSGQTLEVRREHWWAVAGLGLLGNTLYQLLFIFGVNRTTADNAALILATVPVFVALFGSLAGVEHLLARGWIGVTLSLAGIVCIVTGADSGAALEFGGASLEGDFLILLSMLAWSAYSLLMRPVVRRCPPVAVTFWSTVAGTLPLLLITLPTVRYSELQQVPARGWLALGLSALIGIAAPYFIWNHGIRELGSARTSFYSYLVPPVALAVAWIWLGEVLTPRQLFGGLLALVGVVLARRSVRAMR